MNGGGGAEEGTGMSRGGMKDDGWTGGDKDTGGCLGTQKNRQTEEAKEYHPDE